MNSEYERAKLVEDLQREVERLRQERDEAIDEQGKSAKLAIDVVAESDKIIADRDDMWDKCETKEATIQQLMAERDDYKEALERAVVRKNNLKAAVNNLDELCGQYLNDRDDIRKQTARRAVKICEEVRQKYHDKPTIAKVAAQHCKDALRAEFGLDKGE